MVKKNGQREAFSRDKLLGGLLTAMHRRPVAAEVCHEFVRGLELRWSEGAAKEVPSAVLGEEGMTFLRQTDRIAYVRFASVYREFRDIDALMDEMRTRSPRRRRR